MMSIFTKLDVTAAHLSSIGQCAWSSPSNIALVKYWGKRPGQIPQNPSVSLTLEHARSEMKLSWRGRTYQKKGPTLSFLFEGKKAQAFEQKIQTLLESLLDSGSDYLNYFDLEIEAINTFPHSAGIASSASSMSALALCLLEMRQQIFGTPKLDSSEFLQQASYLARKGSGSASRSIFSSLALWGEFESENVVGVNDYAVALPDIHPVFKSYRDAILVIDAGVKKVSSREGHALMNGHPHAKARFERAKKQTFQLLEVLKKGDLGLFAQIVEAEALELHGLMMTSTPPYILMRPGTLQAIEKIWAYREESKLDLCFTLDAGANIHLLYPEKNAQEIETFIKSDLKPLCQNNQVIFDQVGSGPRREGGLS